MSRRGERGVALLAAVAGLAVLSVLAVGLAHTSAVDQHLARNALAAVQADALARSGVAAAAVFLTERDPDAVDWPRAPWAQGSGRQPLGAGWVEVTVEDEARRLPLGVPELADAVPRLFRLLGLDDPALADALLDWTDPDDNSRPLGAERAYYLGLIPPYAPRNAPLASVGELALVRGFTAPIVARLRPYVTIASEARVNPNTASREVLLAVVEDATIAERLLSARAEAAIDPEKDLATVLPGATPEARDALRARLTARGNYYTVRALAGVADLQRAAEATVFAPAGTSAELIAWRPIRP